MTKFNYNDQNSMKIDYNSIKIPQIQLKVPKFNSN